MKKCRAEDDPLSPDCCHGHFHSFDDDRVPDGLFAAATFPFRLPLQRELDVRHRIAIHFPIGPHQYHRGCIKFRAFHRRRGDRRLAVLIPRLDFASADDFLAQRLAWLDIDTIVGHKHKTQIGIELGRDVFFGPRIIPVNGLRGSHKTAIVIAYKTLAAPGRSQAKSARCTLAIDFTRRVP